MCAYRALNPARNSLEVDDFVELVGHQRRPWNKGIAESASLHIPTQALRQHANVRKRAHIPPTSAPSMSGQDMSLSTLSGATDPPYCQNI